MNSHEQSQQAEIAELRRLLAHANARLDLLERRATLVRGAPAERAPATEPPPPPGPTPSAPRRASLAPASRPAAPTRTRPTAPPTRPRRNLEELLNPRVLALIGGGVTFLGLAFLVTIGVSSGWIGPEARVIGAALLSLALAITGTVLHRRERMRTLGRALVATAIGGGYATLLGATVLYDFIPNGAGLAGALLVAAAGAAIGLRWNDQPVVSLALGGALAAPLLIKAPEEAVTVAYLVAALGAAATVASARRWWGLAAALAALALGQLAAIAVDDRTSGVPGLALGWLELTVATLVPVLIRGEDRWREPLWIWTSASSFCALVGYGALFDHTPWDSIWVFSFAAAHLGLAFFARRLRPQVEQLFAFALLAGTGLAALGASLVLSGPVLVVAWSAKAVLLLTGRDARRPWRGLAALALYGLAVGHALLFEAPPAALSGGPDSTTDAALALGALAAAAAAGVRFGPSNWRDAPAVAVVGLAAYAAGLFTSGIAAVALLAGLAIGAVLTAKRLDLKALVPAGWAALGIAVGYALVAVAPPGGDAETLDVLAAAGAVTIASLAISNLQAGLERSAALALAFGSAAYASLVLLSGAWATLALGGLALAAAHLPRAAAWRRASLAATLIGVAALRGLIGEAAPGGLASGADALGTALASLGIVAAAALIAARPFRGRCMVVGERRVSLFAVGAWVSGTAAVYAGSLAIVTLIGGQTSTLGIGGVQQPAQVGLSAYWALIGTGAVVCGLLLGRRALRYAGLGLFGLALAKLFILDLSSLDASHRGVSFIAVGLLLLAASFAYRRLAGMATPPEPTMRPLELAEGGGDILGPMLGVIVALVTGLGVASARPGGPDVRQLVAPGTR